MSKTNSKVNKNVTKTAIKLDIPKSKAFIIAKVTPRQSWLYRFVYSSVISSIVSVMLVSSFFMQGVNLVSASEPDDTVTVADAGLSVTPTEETSVAATPETMSEDSSAEVSSLEEVPSETEMYSSPTELTTETTTLSSDESAPAVTTTTPSVETDSQTSDLPTPDATTDSSSSTTAGQLETDNTTSTSTITATTTSTTTATESEMAVGESETDATDEEIIGPEPLAGEVVSHNYSDSAFSFTKDECTKLASGSFYCIEPTENVLDDALFAAPDQDGDMEIYLVRAGVQTQITKNTYDDAAPYFDINTDTIVWHRFIDDRYQIMSYDISTGIEEQLTHNSTNDMEPTRQGKYTVWQRWNNNNWDIVLFDGVKEEVITTSAAHDLAPYIHGSLVVWNRHSASGEKTIEMYDIKSATYVTINDPDGLSVSNPRMVFVYDSLHPNGDIETKGFDMITRQFIQLDTLPKQLPEKIPETDSTGETRALIQTKPTLKSADVKTTDTASSAPPDLTDPTLSTTTDAFTIDLTAPSTSTDAVGFNVLPTEEDIDSLIIPSFSTTSSEQS